MNYMDYLAKSNPPETIKQHTDKLMLAFHKLITVYPDAFSPLESELIQLAAQYHDVGKANYAFQKKIANAISYDNTSSDNIQIKLPNFPSLDELYLKQAEVPHGYLSPAFMPIKDLKQKYEYKDVMTVINAVYYHHNRDDCTDLNVRDVIVKDLKTLNPNVKLNCNFFGMIAKGDATSHWQDEWFEYAIVKGTLNRIDYAASAGLYEQIELPRTQNGNDLSTIIKKQMDEKHFKLREVQKYMLEKKEDNLVVVASTGIGKTEAACLWGGDKKLFYTLPLKVSINAMYNRLHVQEKFENCAILHSDTLSSLIKSNEQNPYEKYKNMRAFSYPLTICTVDQLFTFVYKYKGSEVIPAVLKYSKIVIDEIQSYTPEIIAKLVYGLKLITMLGGKFAIITATMPPILEKFMEEKDIKFEKSPQFLSTLKRHFISLRKEMDYEVIAKEGKNKKVLVICNTVKKAIDTYSKLQELGCDVYLLHSRFQRRHRRVLEEKIMDFSESNKCGIWVTTQIVEASLDIDFDVLHTEMCTADSLLQRMGRCYRKREYIKQTPNVFIYDTKNGCGTVYDEQIYDLSVKKLKKYDLTMFEEPSKQEYINEVYNDTTLTNSDYQKKLKDSYKDLDSILPKTFSAETARDKFRDIKSYTVMDERTYLTISQNGELKSLINQLTSNDLLTRIKAENNIMDYTVSVSFFNSNIQHDQYPIQLGKSKHKYLDIYRIDAKYEFDEITNKGRGLVWERMSEDENFL